MSGNDGLGKKAEGKIRAWLDDPERGYCFDRIPDQMTGFYNSSNICDFTLYKYPYMYYIESKATWEDRFDFGNIANNQKRGLVQKSLINGVHGLILVLFATHQRLFIIDIRDIIYQIKRENKKSINIKKLDKWNLPYIEVATIMSRKQLLDYSGKFEDYIRILDKLRENVDEDIELLTDYLKETELKKKNEKVKLDKAFDLDIPF